MKTTIYVIVFLLLCNSIVLAQKTPAHYRITFTDKKNNAFSLNEPLLYMSQRAIDRRQKSSIQINETDIPITPSYIEQVVKTGAILINKSKWFNSIVVYINDSTIFPKLQNIPQILTIERISKIYNELKELPQFHQSVTNDSFINELNPSLSVSNTSIISYKYNYGKSFRQINMLGGDYLHINGFNGEGILIAVFDVGFLGVLTLHAFDSLRMQNRIIKTKDFVTPNGNVFDNGTHGLYVLSILTANKPGEFVGTAPGASYILLRTECNDTENPVEEDNWAAAAEYADSAGVDIISSSLGYTLFNDTTQSHTYAQMNGYTARVTNAAQMASQKGILVINSAGNSGNKPWHFIGAPADADNVLVVGAVDSNRYQAPFSSAGPTFDGRIKPDVCAMGFDAYMITLYDKADPGNGTSFSAPIISGLAACLWQMFPNKSNFEIKNAIIKSSSEFQSPTNELGYGIPNFYKAATILNGNPEIKTDKLAASINTSELHVFIVTENEDDFSFTIFNLQGKPLTSFVNTCNKGYNYFNFTLNPAISSGIYILQACNSSGFLLNTKVFKGNN